jgi:predicted metal-dependent phosphotriesterase family hydrolase
MVQTVLGVISVDELGVTLVHEHCVVDATCIFVERKEAIANDNNK